MPQVHFSIVIPTYNRATLISKTLDSILSQEYQNYEVIIVDDGSTDNTEEVVKPYLSEKVCYYKKENAERAAARNFGAQKARGIYVNFFDSDDIALNNHTAEAQRVITQLQNPEWFHLAYAWADTSHNIFKQVNNYKGDTLNNLLYLGNPLSCNGVFIKRTTFLKHLFNEDRALSASEDYELWCRLGARYPLYYSNEITSLVIDHDERSVRTINGEKLINRLELLIKYLNEDAQTVQYYGVNMNKIKMDSYSYIALHLANFANYKIKSIYYLFKSFMSSTYLVKTKRFYATIKNIIIKW